MTFLYIPLFLFFTFLLVLLVVFQHVAFSCRGTNNNNFYDWTNPGLLGVLNFIEFIWGLQFLRDAFNFCVSGAAVDWYWTASFFANSGNNSNNTNNSHWYSPLVRLFSRHWGSVVGGSFLNTGVFSVPSYLIELLTCHPETCCPSAGRSCQKYCCLNYLFDLIRTDAYSYINITGLPFCNSARATAEQCYRSNLFVGGYNPLRHYKFAAIILLTLLAAFLGHFFVKLRVVNYGFWHAAALLIIAYLVVVWFVSVFGDAAEGLLTSFLTEYSLAEDYKYMQLAYPSYRNEIESRMNRDSKLRDGFLF